METVNGSLASTLKIEPGITAIIGSGGKSTLLKTLGLELMRAGGRVLLCTTTHMFPVAGVPWDGSSRRLDAAPWKPGALHAPGCTCEACSGLVRGSICQAGVLDPETGKLSSPAEPPDELAQRFDYVLAEADGSKRLPLKAHAAWEPVLPPERSRTVCVFGASALGQPIQDAAHRPELYASLAEVSPEAVITPAIAARVLAKEGGFDVLFINQADVLEDPAAALQPLVYTLPCPAIYGALAEGSWTRL